MGLQNHGQEGQVMDLQPSGLGTGLTKSLTWCLGNGFTNKVNGYQKVFQVHVCKG